MNRNIKKTGRELIDWITGAESPVRFLIFMVLSIFLIEAVVMGVLHHLYASPLTEALIDSCLLIIFLSPMLYHFLFRPLLRQINERKRTEESLQVERNKLRSILDAMEDGVCIVNRRYDVEYANPVFERNFLPIEGRKCYACFYERTEPCPWCGNAEVFAGKSTKGELIYTRTGRIYDLFATPVTGADGMTAKLVILHDMTERRQAEAALVDSEKQLRHLSSQLLSVQEQERRRISRELHDELGQALTLMKLQVRTVEDGLRGDHAELRDECGHILKYLEQVIDDVRRLSRDLCPTVLEHQGLTAALRWLVGNFARTHRMNVDFDAGSSDLDRLFARDASTHIYRTVQEALTNIGKHSGAETVSITVSMEDGKARFVISDDGRGFDSKRESMKNHAERGMGLSAMEERVRMLGGDFAIWSKKGKGARIAFTVPETGVKRDTE